MTRERRTPNTVKVEINQPEDIYKLQDVLIEKESSVELRVVAEELVSNMVEYNEKGHIVANCKRVDCFIDKNSLPLDKQGFLKLAFCLSEDNEQSKFEPIKINKRKEDLGGYGIKMILNYGWNLKLHESKNYFIIVAKKQ